MTVQARWKQRPPGSNWGDFGADDQCGRINLLTPAKVRQGVAEVREGRNLFTCVKPPSTSTWPSSRTTMPASFLQVNWPLLMR